jgi:hypothetical protein
MTFLGRSTFLAAEAAASAKMVVKVVGRVDWVVAQVALELKRREMPGWPLLEVAAGVLGLMT